MEMGALSSFKTEKGRYYNLRHQEYLRYVKGKTVVDAMDALNELGGDYLSCVSTRTDIRSLFAMLKSRTGESGDKVENKDALIPDRLKGCVELATRNILSTGRRG